MIDIKIKSTVFLFVLIIFFVLETSTMLGQSISKVLEEKNEKLICAPIEVYFGTVTTSQIKGFVFFDFEDSKPFKNAIIELYKDKEYEELIANHTTGEDGKFEFTDLPKGIYYLKAGESKGEFRCSTMKIKVKGKKKIKIKIELLPGV